MNVVSRIEGAIRDGTTPLFWLSHQHQWISALSKTRTLYLFDPVTFDGLGIYNHLPATSG